MPNIKEVIFSVTNRCNLRCRMCDIPSGRVEELPTEEWKKVIEDASRLGAQAIVFSGGEPLLREDIFELILFARKNNLSACLTSNGCLLDKSTALRLSACGVNVVNISIEGTKNTHDYLRGAGSFEKAVSALACLKESKIESTIASTVSRYNYEDLLYILEVAKDHGVTTVRLQPFNIIFLNDRSRLKEFLIDQRDIWKMEDIISKFITTARQYKISINPENYLVKIPLYLSGRKIKPENCAALWYSCPINPNGDVFPCWIEAANNKLIGNVKEGGLYRLWLSEKRAKMLGSILKNGCTGCMMSCYDEVFGRKFLREYVFGGAKKIRKISDYRKVARKGLQSLRGQVTQMKIRHRFYSSYRGSFPVILKRRMEGILSRRRASKKESPQERDAVLSEISLSKRKLQKEMDSL